MTTTPTDLEPGRRLLVLREESYLLNPYGRHAALDWQGITIHTHQCGHARHRTSDWSEITRTTARRMAELIEHQGPDAPVAFCWSCIWREAL